MMNFTLNILKHMEQWILTASESFAPVYPTSIRGTNDQRGYPGNR